MRFLALCVLWVAVRGSRRRCRLGGNNPLYPRLYLSGPADGSSMRLSALQPDRFAGCATRPRRRELIEHRRVPGPMLTRKWHRSAHPRPLESEISSIKKISLRTQQTFRASTCSARKVSNATQTALVVSGSALGQSNSQVVWQKRPEMTGRASWTSGHSR